MALRERLTLRLMFGWFTSVSVGLCALSLMMPPQVAPLALSGSTESECPCEEDGKTSEGELVVSSSRRRRCVEHQDDRQCGVSTTGRHLKIASYVYPVFAIVGHLLVNGLAAPRLI